MFSKTVMVELTIHLCIYTDSSVSLALKLQQFQIEYSNGMMLYLSILIVMTLHRLKCRQINSYFIKIY